MILPGAMLGLLGGGQLGRMFTLRARAMGYRVTVLDPDPLSPAGGVADRHLAVPYTDGAALDDLARTTAAITTEFENVPADTLAILDRRCLVRPPSAAVAVTQDRIAEKSFLRDRGFPTAPFAAVRTADELPAAWAAVGAPALLKTSRLGYDGKGQEAVAGLAELRAAFDRLGGVACVLERRLALERELSVVLARGSDGATVVYPIGENVHEGGILATTMVPAAIPRELADKAEALGRAVTTPLDYTGVLAVELFLAEGRLSVNEIAPRPHNSGHYTQDACVTCQFEQQLRALCGLPLGSTALLSPVAMVNLLGDLWGEAPPRWEAVFANPGARLHLYAKQDPRPGRKMGHVNVLAKDAESARRQALAVREAVRRQGEPADATRATDR